MKTGFLDFNPPRYVEETENLEPVIEDTPDKTVKELSVDVSVKETITEESDVE